MGFFVFVDDYNILVEYGLEMFVLGCIFFGLDIFIVLGLDIFIVLVWIFL